MDIMHHYIEAGSGAPMILLHGNNESAASLSAQIEYFSKYYHVYALDTRGHGKTPRGDGGFNLMRFADDLSEFMAMHNIPRAIIFGFSDGANIAMLFAMKYQKKVGALILCGGNLRPDGVRAVYQLPTIALYALTSAVSLVDYRYRRVREMLGLMVKEPHIAYSDLLKITAPTLVVAGTKDMIKRAHTDAIAGAIKGSEKRILSGSHFLPSEAPDALNRTIYRFLRTRTNY